MIKRFIDKLLGKPAGRKPPRATPLGKRVEVPVSEHQIDPTLLDERAVRVVQTLADAGHEAYIVGGAVRDLLLGRRPKDFDVATDATPEQTKALFRRAFIIGRRFRIVHVVYGRGRDHEVIEVSTFRALLAEDAADRVEGNEKTSKSQLAGKSHVVDASGRVLRDNVWGPQIEDAARRDFTINAMYYEPQRQVVVDYHGGLADTRRKVLRMIGDPATRYREDPVRILRAVRFAAKLGFEIERHSRAPIAELVPLLQNVPVSRLFDEFIKLMQTGHALASLEVLHREGLARGVFPVLDAVLTPAGQLPDSPRGRLVRRALEDTDRRVAESRSVAPSYLLACLLWHDVLAQWERLQSEGQSAVPALQQAIDAVFDARVGDISGRGKLAADMREIWMMQPRFERRTGSGPYGLVEQPRYRAGFDFLLLRAEVGEAPQSLVDWWEDFALGSDDDRQALIETAREEQRAQPGKTRRVPRKGAASGAGASASVTTGASSRTVRAAGDEAASDSPAQERAPRPPRPARAASSDGAAAARETAAATTNRVQTMPADATPGEGTDATDAIDGDAPAKRRRRRRRKPAARGEGSDGGERAQAGADDAARGPSSHD